MSNNLQRYAEQCEQERLKKRLQQDVLDAYEEDTDDLIELMRGMGMVVGRSHV